MAPWQQRCQSLRHTQGGDHGGDGGFYCTGKGSCGRWNYAGNGQCFACAKVPGHVGVKKTVQEQGYGWGWGQSARLRVRRPPRADVQQSHDAQQGHSSIQVLQDTIKGLKAGGNEEPDFIKQLELKIDSRKQQKKEGKPGWQLARDSESLLVKKRRVLAKVELDKVELQLGIEDLQGKLIAMDTKMEGLLQEIEQLEAEASL
eukprot:2493796-Heterocapsa_arctica.AAC.1